MRRTFKDYTKKEKTLFFLMESFWVLSLLFLWFCLKDHDLLIVAVIGFVMGLVCAVLLASEGGKIRRTNTAAEEAARKKEIEENNKRILTKYDETVEKVTKLARQFEDDGASEVEAFQAAEQSFLSSGEITFREAERAVRALLGARMAILEQTRRELAIAQRQQEERERRAEAEAAEKRQADLQAKAIMDELEHRSYSPYFKDRMKDLTGGKK